MSHHGDSQNPSKRARLNDSTSVNYLSNGSQIESAARHFASLPRDEQEALLALHQSGGFIGLPPVPSLQPVTRPQSPPSPPLSAYVQEQPFSPNPPGRQSPSPSSDGSEDAPVQNDNEELLSGVENRSRPKDPRGLPNEERVRTYLKKANTAKKVLS
eukprot:Rmarinus@m.29611